MRKSKPFETSNAARRSAQIKALMQEFDISVVDLQERVQKRNAKRVSTRPGVPRPDDR
jgi:hypothetical protein